MDLGSVCSCCPGPLHLPDSGLSHACMSCITRTHAWPARLDYFGLSTFPPCVIRDAAVRQPSSPPHLPTMRVLCSQSLHLKNMGCGAACCHTHPPKPWVWRQVLPPPFPPPPIPPPPDLPPPDFAPLPAPIPAPSIAPMYAPNSAPNLAPQSPPNSAPIPAPAPAPIVMPESPPPEAPPPSDPPPVSPPPVGPPVPQTGMMMHHVLR